MYVQLNTDNIQVHRMKYCGFNYSVPVWKPASIIVLHDVILTAAVM